MLHAELLNWAWHVQHLCHSDNRDEAATTVYSDAEAKRIAWHGRVALMHAWAPRSSGHQLGVGEEGPWAGTAEWKQPFSAFWDAFCKEGIRPLAGVGVPLQKRSQSLPSQIQRNITGVSLSVRAHGAGWRATKGHVSDLPMRQHRPGLHVPPAHPHVQKRRQSQAGGRAAQATPDHEQLMPGRHRALALPLLRQIQGGCIWVGRCMH